MSDAERIYQEALLNEPHFPGGTSRIKPKDGPEADGIYDDISKKLDFVSRNRQLRTLYPPTTDGNSRYPAGDDKTKAMMKVHEKYRKIISKDARKVFNLEKALRKGIYFNPTNDPDLERYVTREEEPGLKEGIAFLQKKNNSEYEAGNAAIEKQEAKNNKPGLLERLGFGSRAGDQVDQVREKHDKVSSCAESSGSSIISK